jgi:hypothetical protein
MWKQESIVGSIFEGSVTVREGKIYPSIKGSAFVNVRAELVRIQIPCMGTGPNDADECNENSRSISRNSSAFDRESSARPDASI